MKKKMKKILNKFPKNTNLVQTTKVAGPPIGLIGVPYLFIKKSVVSNITTF